MGSCLCAQVELKPEKDSKQLQPFKNQEYPLKNPENIGLGSQAPQSLPGSNKAEKSNRTSNQETKDSKIKPQRNSIISGGKSNAEKYIVYD